jgi:hypothetical protein
MIGRRPVFVEPRQNAQERFRGIEVRPRPRERASVRLVKNGAATMVQ